MTGAAWGGGAPDGTGRGDDAAADLRRLQLDNDDLRAENARLKRSIGERQDEILELGERVARLHADCADARRWLAGSSLRRWADRARRLARRVR